MNTLIIVIIVLGVIYMALTFRDRTYNAPKDDDDLGATSGSCCKTTCETVNSVMGIDVDDPKSKCEDKNLDYIGYTTNDCSFSQKLAGKVRSICGGGMTVDQCYDKHGGNPPYC
jgi:hypothetical protein